MSLDQIDLRIIKSLMEDGRKPFKAIAQELDVSDTTVRKRIRSMQERGIIKRFMVLLDYSVMGSFIKAFIGLKIQANRLYEVVRRLEGFSNVQVLYKTTGPSDLFMEVIFSDIEELSSFLDNELDMEGILETEVNLVISPYKRCPYTGL